MARSRAVASRLSTHAKKVRRGIVAGVAACLRRGVSACRRLSPRAAKKLEVFSAWLRRTEARRLGVAGVAAALVLVVASAFLHEYWRAAFSSQPPLAEQTRRAVREKAGQLAQAIESRLVRRRPAPGRRLDLGDDSGRAQGERPGLQGPRQRQDDRAALPLDGGPECSCWRKLPAGNFPSHLGVTSWTLWGWRATASPRTAPRSTSCSRRRARKAAGRCLRAPSRSDSHRATRPPP